MDCCAWQEAEGGNALVGSLAFSAMVGEAIVAAKRQYCAERWPARQ
jgi:hypothetical protein